MLDFRSELGNRVVRLNQRVHVTRCTLISETHKSTLWSFLRCNWTWSQKTCLTLFQHYTRILLFLIILREQIAEHFFFGFSSFSPKIICDVSTEHRVFLTTQMMIAEREREKEEDSWFFGLTLERKEFFLHQSPRIVILMGEYEQHASSTSFLRHLDVSTLEHSHCQREKKYLCFGFQTQTVFRLRQQRKGNEVQCRATGNAG